MCCSISVQISRRRHVCHEVDAAARCSGSDYSQVSALCLPYFAMIAALLTAARPSSPIHLLQMQQSLPCSNILSELQSRSELPKTLLLTRFGCIAGAAASAAAAAGSVSLLSLSQAAGSRIHALISSTSSMLLRRLITHCHSLLPWLGLWVL